MATREDLRNDILKVTEKQQQLMQQRKPFLGIICDSEKIRPSKGLSVLVKVLNKFL